MTIIACIWPSCEAEQYVRKICRKHYSRAYRLGTFEEPWIAWELKNSSGVAKCKWPGCALDAVTRGYCGRDYSRAQRRGNFDNPWDYWVPAGGSCEWLNCDRSVSYRRMCDMHARRAKSLGYPENPWVKWGEKKAKQSLGTQCIWELCSLKAHAQKLCVKHYSRAASIGNFENPWEAWNPPKECKECGTTFRRAIPRAIYCSPECSRRAFTKNNPAAVKNTYRKRRALLKLVEYEKFTDSDVRSRAGDICYLCNEVIDFDLKSPDPMSPSLDHIFPLSRGGAHTLDNAAMTHLRCNQRKSAKFLAHGPQIALF